ncbi:MAG: acyl-CoA dehydrogenase C-terminal domain-containing protein [Comamonas sp.]
MPSYNPPLRDMQFLMHEVFKVAESYQQMPTHAEVDVDTINAVLEEAGKFAANVTFPLNISGDAEGCTLDKATHEVTTPKGFKQAYAQFVEGGWPALSCDPEYGGQGLPMVLNSALYEMLNSANQAWTMYPGLSHGAYEALHAYGTAEQKKTYLGKLTSGEWTGTMCLTESHCGTDLGLLRSKAEPLADGTYKITGNKIFISAGEHDFTENIVHLVLARLPDAPVGSKGISLFVVPKFLIKADGALGERNPIFCGALEHKMGIHGNATAQINIDGAIGTMVGEPNKGLQAMFVMMNAARLGVGNQSLGLTEVAFQNALAYAKDRLQMRSLSGVKAKDKPADPIIVHPDVRRMLMTMRAFTEGCRAMATTAAAAYDASHHHPDAEVRQANAVFYEFMVPLVKGYSTEMSLEVTSLGVQVHGGMGFIEETGAAQYYRDAKILTIYEGTTAIQANDLVGRKTARDGGETAKAIAAQIEKTEAELNASGSAVAQTVAKHLAQARQAFVQVVEFIAAQAKADPNTVYAGSVPYLMLTGNLVAGWQLGRSVLVAEQQLKNGQDASFMQAKLATAQFYAEHILTRVPGQANAVVNGAASVMALPMDMF